MFGSGEPHPHGSRMLRSFRSHKSLKAEARSQQPSLQITHVSYNHVRKDSESSTITRSSIDSNASRPSTSRTENSSASSVSTIEWDPLRLHPPMSTSAAAPLPERRSHHELRGARSYHQLRSQHASFRSLQAARSAELEIYEGFDFGFGSAPTAGFAGSARPPPVSAWSYSTRPCSMADSDVEDEAGAEWVEDHGLTPRPHHHYPTGAGEGVDYFIKRGSWKRRGIVFSPGMTMASEDECFDLEQ